MWRESLDIYVKNLVQVSDDESALDLHHANALIQQQNLWNEFDRVVEDAIATHLKNPMLMAQAASCYQSACHFGRMIGGEFERGGEGNDAVRLIDRVHLSEDQRGAGVNTSYRDRIRSMQLIRDALKITKDESEQYQIWKTYAAFYPGEAWKLQTLTPIDNLPGWTESGPAGGTEGAPWSKDAPVTYDVPLNWEASKNDGERWRFALSEMSRLKPTQIGNVTITLAQFSQSQFGTETLSSYGWWNQQDPEKTKGILELETLAENECLAKTSDGVRRFKLPDSKHFIALYRSVLADPTVGNIAGDALVDIFLNRLQYDKAREVLEQTITKYGLGSDRSREKLLKQIVGRWGRFGTVETVAAGTYPNLPLVFRNATRIKFTASQIDMDAVLRDTTDYLRSNPRELDWQRLNASSIAQRLISQESSKYIGKPVTSWESKLAPNARHRDTRADISAPLKQAGTWWIRGDIDGGNSFYTMISIVDAVLVQNDVGGMKQWWVADAITGAPVAESEIEFFGYRVENLDRENSLERRTQVLTKEFKRLTDADGKTLLKPGDWDENYQWMAIARKKDRTPAFFGFQAYIIQTPQLENGNRDLTYGISDRSIYKPGDTVHLKYYFRNVGYFEPDEDKYKNKLGDHIISNGRGEEVIKIKNLKTDAYGAVECEFIIPKDGGLGTWNAKFQIGDEIACAVNLLVEEYRKPEYEVKVEAPSKPVKLGDKFTATVKATYFHGSPVRNADVEVIVKRVAIRERWFPYWRWDWLYGAGAWWNQYEAPWHPTWKSWGCLPPHPPWRQGSRWAPDELVLKRNLPIGPDGTLSVEVDTTTAKEIHGDMDANYTIEARVVDASRREERGTGSVIAARKPFEVIVWTDRGYTRAGESIEATVSASTLAGIPVVGAKGTLTIFSLSCGENGRVEEQETQSFVVETDAAGEIRQRFVAPVTGQYRISARLSSNGNDVAEGAAILNVQGPGRSDPAAWKFGPLELIADRVTHTAGEKLKLRVNSDQPNANVWLFLHVAGSSGREARRIQLDGKSLEVEVPLDLRDMPNMFIEGVTVFGAQVHTAVRQVLLPPISQLIDVTLVPLKARVKPRESSALRVILRGADGKPVVGTAVVSIYDKSLEAISGGSNIGAIGENFWSWKNSFYSEEGKSSIPSSYGNLVRMNAVGMQPLGRFGGVMNDRDGQRGFGKGGARMMMKNNAEASGGMALMASSSAGIPMADSQMDMSKNYSNGNKIIVRKDFADLLKWSGAIQTDAEGHAEIPLAFPDNLTTWKARVWVLTKGTRVGEGSAEIITSKELLVRLQAPRFLVERDESVFSAVVQNDHDFAKTVKVSLELEGNQLEAIDGEEKTVEIAARSEARVDWRVKALREGEATIRMRVDDGDAGDAVERKLPVKVHGMLRQDAWSRVLEPDKKSVGIEITVPEQRREQQSKLTIRFSPSIAGVVVDAIPYLASFPYGSTEQTLNRFVPTVIAQKMLRDLKINLAEVKAKRINLNPQELGNTAVRAAQWKQWQTNPVFDELEVAKMTEEGIEKIRSMQNSDGGWGWFSGYGEASYPHTTAVVVHGLLVAKQNATKIPSGMLDSGIDWLTRYERKQTDAMQFHVEREALRKTGKKIGNSSRLEKSDSDAIDAFVRYVLGEADRDSDRMLAFLYRDRIALPVYAKCLLGLEEHRKGDGARRDEVMMMISQFLKRDAENQTAYLDLQNMNFWWNWYGSEIEANAWYLKLLSAVKPQDADTCGLAKYLVNNRKHSNYWESTRDTSFAIEAIASYFKASGEDTPEMEVNILLDGKSLRKVSINRDNLFSFDGSVVLTGDAVTTGKHDIQLEKTGKGTLYANAYLEVFTLEDKLRAAGMEVKVTREISKLVPLEKETEVPDANGQIARQQVERFRREPIADGGKVTSGDRVEVELVLESKNDYEYLILSDAKAAGFEVLDALSGYVGDRDEIRAYMEPRDRTVDFFIRALPRGRHVLRYQLRAESLGNFKALPATVEAVYAPELKGNSEDKRLEIFSR